jgi:hypothetical protein
MKKLHFALLLFAIAMAALAFTKSPIERDTGPLAAATNQHHDVTTAPMLADKAKIDYPDHPSCASSNCHHDNTGYVPDKKITAMMTTPATTALPEDRAALDIGNTIIIFDQAALQASNTKEEDIRTAVDIGQKEIVWSTLDQGIAATSPKPDQAKTNTTLAIPWHSLNTASSMPTAANTSSTDTAPQFNLRA